MKKETSLYDLLSIVLCHIKSIIIVSVCAALATFGLTYNEYSGIFSNVITLDDLFTDY